MESPYEDLIRRALAEDVGDGDITTESVMQPSLRMRGNFIAKEAGVIAGLQVAAAVFRQLDAEVRFEAACSDGEQVTKGQRIATVCGSARALLSGERTALNFMQRMSGIATATRRFVDAVAGTKATILDTRKTVPGLRLFDKEAVRLGGGSNHRIGLFDMVLIKENHIAAAGGSISEAVRRVRAHDARKRPIEVEVKNLDELGEALALGLDRIMLDNMSREAMREAVRICAGRCPLEASGNVTLANVADVAATGVDFISVGALTHSVQALDISLLLEAEKS